MNQSNEFGCICLGATAGSDPNCRYHYPQPATDIEILQGRISTACSELKAAGVQLTTIQDKLAENLATLDELTAQTRRDLEILTRAFQMPPKGGS